MSSKQVGPPFSVLRYISSVHDLQPGMNIAVDVVVSNLCKNRVSDPCKEEIEFYNRDTNIFDYRDDNNDDKFKYTTVVGQVLDLTTSEPPVNTDRIFVGMLSKYARYDQIDTQFIEFVDPDTDTTGICALILSWFYIKNVRIIQLYTSHEVDPEGDFYNAPDYEDIKHKRLVQKRIRERTKHH